MVADLLRLRLQLLGKGMTRSVAGGIGRVLLAVLGIVLVIAAFLGVRQVGEFDPDFVRRFVVVFGSMLVVAAFGVPALAARRDLVDPRMLRGYGIRTRSLAPTLLLIGLAGPILLVLPLAALPAIVWHDSRALAVMCWTIPLLAVQTLVAVRLGTVVGAGLATRARLRVALGWVFVVVELALLALLLVVSLNRAVAYLPSAIQPSAFTAIRMLAPLHAASVADWLAWTPLGALWAAPAPIPGASFPWTQIIIGAAGLGVLLVLWVIAVRYGLRATRRIKVVRRREVPGWFRIVPEGPLGAVLGRSLTYWFRDPRYWTVFVILPFLVLAMGAAMWIGGVPQPVAALIPIPIAVLVLAWSTLHNDVALDSTAVWSHLAAQIPGEADRVGRAIPVIVFGGILTLVGVPLTAWFYGDSATIPVVLGLCLAVLLGGAGVSSAMSARAPYPAPRPGDGAFQHPQSGAAEVDSGFGAQASSFFLIVAVALPAIAASVMWVLFPTGPWNWIALALGAVAGVAALILGVRRGARDFDEGSPELLAFTMRT